MDIETLKALTQEDIVWILTERADDVKAAKKIISAERTRASKRKYLENHKDDHEFKEKARQRRKRYYERNSEKLIAKSIEYQRNNKEKYRMREKEYYQRNREALSEKKKKNYREKKIAQEEEKKKRAVKVITAASIGIPTVETKRLHKITTPFETDTDMKPKTDKEKLADFNRKLRQLEGRKDHMEWEEWWRQRNIILLHIENIEQRMGKKYKVF